ncbi:MAG: biosynthetic-type acetolactate synthase large subunit [Bacteroidaceae bacterium]|nr:biosynthetic-type acetolactate synthase large subunit [Bacteroidaceae bacterium]
MGAKIKGSEILLKALTGQKVDTIFAYPGGNIISVFDVMMDYRDKINQILVRHEQGAAHAAEGYARVSGRVGVAIVTSGPGVTNTITGIADAMLDSTPIVVIAGQAASTALGTDAFQEVDLVGITQPITKWSYQIRRTEDITMAVAKAFYIASTGRPGPVVLDFTKDAQAGLAEYKPYSIDYIRSYIPKTDVSPASIEQAAELIDNCRKPLVLVGQGVELAGAQQELQDFIEKGNLPAARTLLGLSALSSDHPLNMGMLGLHGNAAPNILTNQADLIIAVGMRFDDRVTGVVANYAKKAKIIHLDIDKSEIGKIVPCDVPILGDCKESLPMLTARIKKNSHADWIKEFAPLAQKEKELVIDKAIAPASGPIKMGETVHQVALQAPDNSVMVTDVGLNQMFAVRYFKYRSRRSIVSSGGLGTMGFAIPAAIGAATGAPERPVIMFAGDGGIQMTIQEFGTIMEYHIPVKMVVMNNHYLGNVRQWQHLMFNDRYSLTHMLSPVYQDIAAAYGFDYMRIEKRQDLEAGVKAMLAAKGPFFLEVVVEDEENVWPMIRPGSDVDQVYYGPQD